MRSLLLVAPLAALALGCTPHIGRYRPKVRAFDPGAYEAVARPAGASIYARGARNLAEDDRPGRPGDLVVIQIDEADSASHDASTRLGKKSAGSLGFSGGLVSALQKVVPAVELTKLLGMDSGFDFNGLGQVRRNGRVSATLPVRVRRVLPNDDLYVEGMKVLLVGNEERFLYVSGVVRLADVRADGTVPSSRVADAEIEYAGRGDVSDQQRPGWLTRFLGKAWPL